MARNVDLLVTVGTTEFDYLIRSLDTAKFASFVKQEGFTRVFFQIGRGQYEPHALTALFKDDGKGNGIFFSWFRFVPNLSELVNGAHTVISHCGAGTILEVLDSGARLVVAVNETLMGNHQMELADALFARGQCQVIYPATALADLAVHPNPNPNPNRDRNVVPDLFPQLIDQAMGFPAKE